jgi:hypothetical protein
MVNGRVGRKLKSLPQIADVPRSLRHQRGSAPMTKIEAFRLAAREMGSVNSEALSAYIESKFGISIDPRYIPLFQATLRFQKSDSRSELSEQSSSLPSATTGVGSIAAASGN